MIGGRAKAAQPPDTRTPPRPPSTRSPRPQRTVQLTPRLILPSLRRSIAQGRKGIYAGMGTHVARVVPNSALMFMSYEIVQNWIRTENKKTLAMREDLEEKQRGRRWGRTNSRTCFTK